MGKDRLFLFIIQCKVVDSNNLQIISNNLRFPTIPEPIISVYETIQSSYPGTGEMINIRRSSRWLASLTLAVLFALNSLPTYANTWPLPAAGSRLVGENKYHVVENDGGSLESIAKKYNVGFLALLQANPGVDAYVPRAGSILTIPLQTLLPDVPREGIVINLAELRLYYYPPGSNTVNVYPIGIGQLDSETLTPTMVTTVSDKRANPTWTPTANIRKRYKAQGIILPAVMPAGPDNPMGHHAIRLAAYGGVYLIHGTNADFGIGMRVSSGCIRLRDGDISALFNAVQPGTKVNIINTPIKASVEPNGVRLVEVHQPLSKSLEDDPSTLPVVLNAAMEAFKVSDLTAADTMESAMQTRSGMPVDVSVHHSAQEGQQL